MKVIRLFSLALIFFVSACSTQYGNDDTAAQQAETVAKEFINQKKASAITIALVDPDRIIWNRTFGLADPKTGEAATNNTLFGIGSVSKIIATIAVMKLVERGRVNLDTRLVNYLPAFSMASPGYKDITVRMLLNHSAGFPGTDFRNSVTRSPYSAATYADQVLQTLAQSRLKAPPGYTNVYCNDCFTVIELLVKSTSGKSYVQFVQDEIFTPLKMRHTRFPVSPFPDKSYAKAYVDGIIRPQEFVNTYASGGIYSTARDLAHIAMLFLNAGAVRTTRILSPASVAAMAKDQTIGSFNPVRNNAFSFGLGWDSISQPGLLAVGFDGWAKGGDSVDYGAMLIVSPKARLGVVVIGASNFGSKNAQIIAEQVLLRALVERHLIPEFPSPISTHFVEPASVNSMPATPAGEYALHNLILKFQQQPDEALILSTLSDRGWKPSGSPLKPQPDGGFIDPELPLTEMSTIDTNVLGEHTQYLAKRTPGGYGHYFDSILVAQKLPGAPAAQQDLSPAWKNRLDSTWLVVNEHPDAFTWAGMNPRLRLSAVPDHANLIAVRPPEGDTFHIINPSSSDTEATMMLIIPQLNGRDLNDLIVIKQNNEEWIRFGSYMHRPLSTVPVLSVGMPLTITIASQGYAEWRAIASNASTVEVTINTAGEWHLYGPTFNSLDHGRGSAAISIPPGLGLNYMTFFGEPGKMITLLVRQKT